MKDEQPTLKVGSTIWHFDQNRRVYPPTPEGKIWPAGGPIYREHWHEVQIIEETSRSWVTLYGKAPKKGPHPGFAFTMQEIDDDCWLKSHRYAISSAVEKCRDAQTLRQIADLLNFAPPPTPARQGR